MVIVVCTEPQFIASCLMIVYLIGYILFICLWSYVSFLLDVNEQCIGDVEMTIMETNTSFLILF